MMLKNTLWALLAWGLMVGGAGCKSRPDKPTLTLPHAPETRIGRGYHEIKDGWIWLYGRIESPYSVGKVAKWYEDNLGPEFKMRKVSNSLVLFNDGNFEPDPGLREPKPRDPSKPANLLAVSDGANGTTVRMFQWKQMPAK